MEFFNIGPMELLLVLVVALLVFGPQRLPEIAAKLGKAINDFKVAQRSLTNEFAREFKEDEARRSAPQSATAVDEAAAQAATSGGSPTDGASTAADAPSSDSGVGTEETSASVGEGAAVEASQPNPAVASGDEAVRSGSGPGSAVESSSADPSEEHPRDTESELFDWEAEPSQRQ